MNDEMLVTNYKGAYSRTPYLFYIISIVISSNKRQSFELFYVDTKTIK